MVEEVGVDELEVLSDTRAHAGLMHLSDVGKVCSGWDFGGYGDLVLRKEPGSSCVRFPLDGRRPRRVGAGRMSHSL